MKVWEVQFINGKLGSGDNSEQKAVHNTQKISVFQSDHPYSKHENTACKDFVFMLLTVRQQRVLECWILLPPLSMDKGSHKES